MPTRAGGGQLSGEELRQYLESFAEQFLKDKIRFSTEVISVRRPDDTDSNWIVIVEDAEDGTRQHLLFNRIVLCTGVRPAFVPEIFIAYFA